MRASVLNERPNIFDRTLYFRQTFRELCPQIGRQLATPVTDIIHETRDLLSDALVDRRLQWSPAHLQRPRLEVRVRSKDGTENVNVREPTLDPQPDGIR